MTSPPDLTIITISTNELFRLRDCLPSVPAAAGALRIEHVVIDNASIDGTSLFVASQFPSVTLLRNERKTGFATNNNLAINRTDSRYVLLLNPDTVLTPGSLEKIVRYCDDHSDVGAASCKLVNPDGSLQHNVRRFPTLLAVMLRWAQFERFHPNSKILRDYLLSDWDHNSERDIDWAIGAFLLVRRQVIAAVGPLDAAYDPLYYEDIDWCFRIKQNGWKIRFVPGVQIIHHYHRESARGIFNKMTYIHFRNIVRFLVRRWRAERHREHSAG